MIVYIVQHLRESKAEQEDVKFIGVYSTQAMAADAVARIGEQPGFNETKSGFSIEEYEVDKDHWTEGFATLKD